VDSIVRTSPAKINLFLEVSGKRSDGYHEIFSWMHTVDLSDHVTVAHSSLEHCTLRTRDTTIPFGKRNLCIKAYDAICEETGLKEKVEITLEKSIPLGSGLAGGSSNAASVLVCLNELFELGIDDDRLRKISADIGSDVPFFITGGSALALGRGTDIRPLPTFPDPVWLVIAKSEVSVSTGDAYKWIKKNYGDRRPDEKELATRVEAGDLEYVCDMAYNAFEEVICNRYPVVREIEERLKSEGCMATLMTGSGSAVFGICENRAAAENIASSMSDWDILTFCRTCRTL